MRLHVISDIHLEFGKFRYEPPACDVVILSGDISPGVRGVVWAQETYGVPVVYTPGNHEFYGKRRLLRHIEKMKAKAEGSNVHVLYNDTVEIGGVRFIGATLWTDFNLYGNHPRDVVIATAGMKEFDHDPKIARIWADIREPFTTDGAIREHMLSRLYLIDEMRKPFDGKTVVVTHHAPSGLSIHPQWENHNLNPAYASRLEDVILDGEPDLWTHGHMHDNADYVIGKTRVVCNPRGYVPDEINPAFDPHLVVEI